MDHSVIKPIFDLNYSIAKAIMKKGIKVFISLPAILLLLIFPIVSAWAASKNKPESLTGKEITIGMIILMASLFIPALRSFRKNRQYNR